MKTKEKIMYDDPSIVELKKVEGWVGKDGRFYGKDEHMARWANCTHMICDCGTEMDKGYTKCKNCRDRQSDANFNNLELVEWDKKTPLTEWHGEKFFFDEEAVYDHCEYFEIEPSELRLVLCEKSVHISEVNIDELNEEYCTEDEGLSCFHPEIAAKCEELNELIRNAEPKLWFGTNKRVEIKDGRV